MRFFISFASEDVEVAQYLANTLNDLFRGHATFFHSALGIAPSELWLERIRIEIDNSAAILVVLTDSAIDKPWVNIEFGAFWASGKLIFPLLCCGLSGSRLHRPVSDYQYVMLTSPHDVTRLVETVANLSAMVSPPAHDPVAVVREIERLCGRDERSFKTKQELRKAIALSKPLRFERVDRYMIDCTSPGIQFRSIGTHVLEVSGFTKDSAAITLQRAYRVGPKRHLILRVQNSGDSICEQLDKMLKVCVNKHVLRATAERQRHFNDEEYIYKADGYFAYELPQTMPAENSLFVEFLLWRARLYQLRLSFAFV